MPASTGNRRGAGTKAMAVQLAAELGCVGTHQMPDGKFMPCKSHEELISTAGVDMFDTSHFDPGDLPDKGGY